MSTHCFEYADHASDKVTRRPQTGILIFCNQAPVMWLSNKHNLVETSTFGSEFTALKLTVELVIALRYKLHMFGGPLEGPIEMFCDEKGSVKGQTHPILCVAQETPYHRIS